MPKSPDELFAAALALTNPAQRAALLDRECAGKPALRTEVESLLAAHEQAGTFISQSNPTVAVDISVEKPGDKIGRYKLREKVGEGGCGVVYVAEQEEPIRRRVALKVIKLGMDTKQVIARFEAERQALAMMDHPNIAKVLDAGAMENGRPYFVMELVRGIRITDYCDQNHLDTTQRLGLFIQVCNAVQHAHQKGIIHRDLKPSNILVTLHDGVPVPKVIDFGIAKATEGRLTDLTVYTELRQFIGTPAYMSPEQAEMSGLDIDTRSDIYALGVLLYELLTGKTPFDANELVKAGLDEMRRRIREDEPPRPSTRLSTLTAVDLTDVAKHRGSEAPKLIHLIRGDLDWIVMKCLEKDRTRRYETTNGLAMDIKRHLTQEPVQARPPSRVYRMQKFARRNKVGFAAATAVAAMLVIGAVISSWQAIRAMRAERHAQGEATRAQQAETVAIEKATVAESERRRADESAEELRRNLYAADMNAVSQAWEKGDIGLMRKLLDTHRPKPGQQDLRGFEWFYFWKASEGEQKELFSFDTSQTAVIRPEDISRDGSLLVIARTNELDVFNLMTRKTVAKWSLPAQDPNLQRDASLTSDNKFVAMTDSDGLHLFEIATLRERILPVGDCEGVRLSPTGHLAAISLRSQDLSLPAPLRIWDYQTGNEVRSIPVTNAIGFLDWSSDGKKLYIQQGWGNLIVWDIESGSSNSIGFLLSAGLVVAVSPDGRNALRTDYRGELSVVGAESRRVLASSGFPQGQTSAWFSADGSWFATIGPDGQIVVWDCATWKTVSTLRGHSDEVWTICFLPHENRLVSLGNDRTVRLWEFGQTSNTSALTNNLGTLANDLRGTCAMQFSPSGNLVTLPTYTSVTNSETLLWNLNAQTVKAKLKGLAVGFSPNGQQLLVHAAAQRLQVWDVESQKVGHEFVLESNTNAFPKLSADGRFLAYRSWDFSLGSYFRVYSAAGETVYSTEKWVRCWAFSPDSRLLALNDSGYVNDDGATLLLKELSGPVERRVPRCGASCLAFSPDGRLLAAGTFPPGVNLVDVATGTVIAKLRGHQTMVTAVAFSPDGKTLASGAQDRTIRLYNVETRREVAVFQVSSVVLSLGFSPDGQTLVSSEPPDETGPGHYRFWYAPRVDAPPLPLPALHAPAPDSIWVAAYKLKNTVQHEDEIP